MSDITAKGIAAPAGADVSTMQSGLIDVSGLSFAELSAAIGADDLGRALDYIVASGQNGCGFHGFNSSI